MRRGDVVTVAAAGDYGKPRPAVVVQTDALPTHHASVIVRQMTPEVAEAPDFRVTVASSAAMACAWSRKSLRTNPSQSVAIELGVGSVDSMRRVSYA
jgi:mRNA-degrading endonuclease toxin of MazEF toxin-antitoxin module